MYKKKHTEKSSMTAVQRLYWHLIAIKYGVFFVSLMIMLSSVLFLEKYHLPFGAVMTCYMIGAISIIFSLLIPRAFWRCPFCKEYLNTGYKGTIKKPGKFCPHCKKEYT